MRNEQQLPLLYNPAEKDRNALIADFVLRQKQFDLIFDDIKSSKMRTPEQHYLITGQRGMGKTTLLYRLKYAIEDDEKLSKWLVPVTFPEEQYRIGDLAALWEIIAEYLEEYDHNFAGLHDSMKQVEENDDYEGNIFSLLTKALDAHKKKLIIFIDNIGHLLGKFEDNENRRLREILMTDPHIRLIAASAEVLEHTFNYDKPFFEFFKSIKLHTLKRDETITLLKHLGQIYKSEKRINQLVQEEPHRIETMRRLTGGVIRTMIIMFEIFVDSKDGEVYKDLEVLLDRVTPLYKHRMDDLKPQQQQIVDAVARAWDAITVKEILADTTLSRKGINSKHLSAQLKQLVDNEVLEIEPTAGKIHLYRIRERFFNIWYLMRVAGRKDKDKVKWLVRFFEAWCSTEELSEIINNHVLKLKTGDYQQNSAYYKSLALCQLNGLDNSLMDILFATTHEFISKFDKQQAIHFVKQTSVKQQLNMALMLTREQRYQESNDLLNVLNPSITTLVITGINYIQLQKFEKAEEVLALIDKAYPNFKDDETTYHAYLLIQGTLYQVKEQFEEAEKIWMNLIDSNATAKAAAANYLGLIWRNYYHNVEKSKKYFLKAIEWGDKTAYNTLGETFFIQKDYLNAAKYLRIAYEQNCIGYLAALIFSYLYAENLEDALVIAEEVTEINDHELEFGVSAAYALNAIKFGKKGDFANSYRTYVKALNHNLDLVLMGFVRLLEASEINEHSDISIIIEQTSSIMVKSILSLYLEDSENFEKYLKQAILDMETSIEKYPMITEVLTYIAAKGMYNILVNLFLQEDLKLKDKLRPFYYALMYFMQDEYPNEYLRAGDEMKETIQEIISKIEEWHKLLETPKE